MSNSNKNASRWSPEALRDRMAAAASELGFSSFGVAAAGRPPHWDRFVEWLEAGRAGTMEYLPRRRAAYEHPRHVLKGCRSVIMLGMNYRTAPPPELPDGCGRVASYAWGNADYHDVIHGRLKQLRESLLTLVPEAAVRGVVDTAPLLEREFAQLAGLGWIGKHTLLLSRSDGSWFFLAALLTDIALPPDAPFADEFCGSCRACLDACPTEALPAPYELDARRCISYLTIEHRGPIPVELRAGMGEWVFGCDVCQDVCPWNRKPVSSDEAAFEPQADLFPLDLVALFDLDDDSFRARFRKTPLWRVRRRGLLRNAAIVLGNRPVPRGESALLKGLVDREPLVRGASAWALRFYRGEPVDRALEERLRVESDPQVLVELRQTLAHRQHAESSEPGSEP